MSDLMKGKTALIMGVANRWSLAHAIATSMAREGARLILTYQGERQRPVVEELAHGFPQAEAAACDVSQDAAVEQLFAGLQASGTTLDALVHSIAFANREDLERPFYETGRAGFLMAMELSAYSFVSAARFASTVMPRGGSMTTLSYIGATRVLPNYNVMGVAKAALESCVRYLASELGPRGIRVNAISAGPIKTASARAIKNFSTILDQVPQRAPLRRNTDPAEVGDAAVFLASDLGRGVTGDILFVDSGCHVMGF